MLPPVAPCRFPSLPCAAPEVSYGASYHSRGKEQNTRKHKSEHKKHKTFGSMCSTPVVFIGGSQDARRNVTGQSGAFFCFDKTLLRRVNDFDSLRPEGPMALKLAVLLFFVAGGESLYADSILPACNIDT